MYEDDCQDQDVTYVATRYYLHVGRILQRMTQAAPFNTYLWYCVTNLGVSAPDSINTDIPTTCSAKKARRKTPFGVTSAERTGCRLLQIVLSAINCCSQTAAAHAAQIPTTNNMDVTDL